MLPLLRLTTFSMAAMVLLAQMLSPVVAAGCGCTSTWKLSADIDSQTPTCCCGQTTPKQPGSCGGCCRSMLRVSDSNQDLNCDGLEQTLTGDGFHSRFMCRCGDLKSKVPQPVAPAMTDAPVEIWLDLIESATIGIVQRKLDPPSPDPPPALSCEQLIRHHKQVALGVWRT